MAKFCPNCGFKLDSDYKFCPDCGFKIESVKESDSNRQISSDKIIHEDEKIVNPIICENCGEENDPSNIECSSCGIKLRNVKTVQNTSSSSEKPKDAPSYPKRKSHSPKTVNKKPFTGKPPINPAVNKKLNNIKIITVVSIGLGLAIIILIFSGALNSLVLPSGETATSQKQNTTSGVDLSNLQKINSLETQIKNNPQDTTSILELAHLKNDAGLYDQAIINYKQYLALVPKDPDARIDMGICYYNLQNYDTAIKEMEQAITYDPKHQIGYLDLGIVNLAAGNLDKSKEMLKKAVELDPNSDYGKKAEELLKSHSTTENKNGGQ